MKKLNAETLAGVKDAENTLARREKRESDISSMFPPGHPVRVAHERARDTFIANQPVQGAPEPRKIRIIGQDGKEIKPKNTAKPRRGAEELDELASKQKRVLDSINSKIDDASKLLIAISRELGDSERLFTNDPMLRVRIARLKRLAAASCAGLSESRIKTGRIS